MVVSDLWESSAIFKNEPTLTLIMEDPKYFGNLFSTDNFKNLLFVNFVWYLKQHAFKAHLNPHLKYIVHFSYLRHWHNTVRI